MLERPRGHRGSSQTRVVGSGDPDANEEVTRSTPGTETPNVGAWLSQKARQPQPVPVPARFPGPGPRRRPLPGLLTLAAGAGARAGSRAHAAELSRSHGPHPADRAGAGRGSGPALGGGPAPSLTSAGFSPGLARPRRPRPGPAHCPRAPSARCVRRPLSAGLSVRPPRTVQRSLSLANQSALHTFLHSRPGTLRPPAVCVLGGVPLHGGCCQCCLPRPAANHTRPGPGSICRWKD